MNSRKHFYTPTCFLIALLIVLATSCEKKAELTYLKGTGTVTDVHGNIYKTVIIGHPFLDMGTQEWMAEDLRVTKFNNEVDIPLAASSTAWHTVVQDRTPQSAWCDFDPLGMGDKYGILYNYYAAASTNGLCPDGWRVPSKEDFETLMIFFGGRGGAAARLKSTRTEPMEHPRWNSPNTAANNEVEFNALPGGLITGAGHQIQIGESAWWWSTSTASFDQTFGIAFHANFNDDIIGYGPQPKWDGRYIRCIKNE